MRLAAAIFTSLQRTTSARAWRLHGRLKFSMARPFSARGSGIYYGPGSDRGSDPADRKRSRQPDDQLRIPTCVSVEYALRHLRGYDINSPSLGFQPRAYAPGYRVPERILSYTFSVQQQLPLDMIATVAYVGSQGTKSVPAELVKQDCFSQSYTGG